MLTGTVLTRHSEVPILASNGAKNLYNLSETMKRAGEGIKVVTSSEYVSVGTN